MLVIKMFVVFCQTTRSVKDSKGVVAVEKVCQVKKRLTRRPVCQEDSERVL
jgi:hypothetical protein